MALKYWFEFTDIKEIIHRVEISNTAFTGASTQIYGRCSLEVSETKDTLDAIRGSGLKIEIEANSNLTFYDLYSEEERTFSVVYKRNNQILFNGWLSPEGLYEDYVADHWIISLDCTDGLGFLNNLSYVEDATGLTFSGKQTLLEIVVNCLKRTKTPQNILTSINIYYVGLSQSVDPFVNVSYNVDRFIKDDEKTIMNCQEVLKSVLEPFGAVLTSYNGEWLIYKPNSLVDASSQTFFSYSNLGVALSPTTKTIDFSFAIGSQIDNYYPHHVNANQQKSIKSSIGAFRINYKYGLVKSLLRNIDLYSENGVVDNFTIDSLATLVLPSPNGFGVGMPFSNTIANGLNMTSNACIVALDDVLTLNIDFTVELPSLAGTFKFQMVVSDVELPNAAAVVYHLQNDLSWSTTTNGMTFNFQNKASILQTFNLAPIPQNGFLYLYIQKPQPVSSIPTQNTVTINQLSLVPEGDRLRKEGENHTFQRTLKPSSKIKDIKKVFNGDNPSQIYFGTIYKADQTTPTENWTRYGASETKPILRIMGEERMKMYATPLQVFSGDVYGYFNYLSLVTINGLTGKFMPTRYQYNAFDNTTSLILTEVLNTDILSDVEYLNTPDYGEVVEPTIKG